MSLELFAWPQERIDVLITRFATVRTFSVDGHRRCNYELLELLRPLDHFLEQNGRSEIVRLYILDDLVHRLPDADLGCLMVNDLDSV